MMTADLFQTFECERFARQLAVDKSKSREARNRLGQFSTPEKLARQIVLRTLAHCGRKAGSLRFLEPALGSGVFWGAARASRLVCGKDNIGCEIDSDYARVAASVWGGTGLSVREMDFFSFAEQAENAEAFNLICTNPPYVRNHHIPAETKQSLQRRVKDELGITVSGLSGLYVYFILLAHRVLAKDGVAAWLVPSEFLTVNYGKALREYLAKHVSLISIEKFKSSDVQFADALVSSCVITYRKKPPRKKGNFVWTEVDGETRTDRLVPYSALDAERKWNFLTAEARTERLGKTGKTIADYFTVKRGIATGGNSFFVLSEETVCQYEIPKQFLKPILPSPRFLSSAEIRSTRYGKEQSEHFLFDCDLPPDVIKTEYPTVWRYLEKGMTEQIDKGAICRARRLWYRQDKRAAAPIVVSYMGRGKGARKAPLTFYANLVDGIATNGFLNLYPRDFWFDSLKGREERILDVLHWLSGIAEEDIKSCGREYGGGLCKIEPRELLAVPLSEAPSWLTQ